MSTLTIQLPDSLKKSIEALAAKDGYSVSIVQNPTSSLADDVAATKRVLSGETKPVILVGHSYGGVVITEAGNDPKVAGLVYIAAFAPDKGESVAALIKKRARSRNGFAAIATVRRRVHRIEFSELLDIVEIWVGSALRLNPRDLKLMQRLVSRQNGLGDSIQVH